MVMRGRWAISKGSSPSRLDVRQLLAEAKSVISLAMNYYTLDPPKALAEDPAHVDKFPVMLGATTITMSSVNVFLNLLILLSKQPKLN